MVYRVYVEKKKAFAMEAEGVLRDIRSFLGIAGVENVRLLNRYDVENIDEALFLSSRTNVFSEPMVDDLYDAIPDADYVFAVEYLPGQYDQRADSAAQCIQLISRKERPTVKNARVYCLYGSVSGGDLDRIKRHLINPVESREASLERFDTLDTTYEAPKPIETIDGFCALSRSGLQEFLQDYALAMDIDDLAFTQDYFKSIGRDPTVTEIRVLDTYWSDHCRHTTFTTEITDVTFEDEHIERSFARYLKIKEELGRGDRPITLMDVATAGMRYLKKTGKLKNLDESEEINACTVKTKIVVDGKEEDWLFLFKNETHNHPTEIEPFGGAATCIGGAIRDPLSGRSFVYQAMRVTGAGDPTAGIEKTLPGKLPQRRITTIAANGYSSYGNQIGLATGHVDEIYHPGYVAKRMEIGAVVGAAPQENVVRETPEDGDIVILLGGRTGRDGVGGATGSSKTHNLESLETSGAEVQKGNAPEERKLQRLFRDKNVTRMIKRCNDFGAGGVAVAIGELADGLSINLDAVPKKYEGLGGTELAISESQERMAVVVKKEDAERFIAHARRENLEATVVAVVTTAPRLVMRWQGQAIVDIDRSFLNTNGAPKYTKAHVVKPERLKAEKTAFKAGFTRMTADLNCANKRGLVERFCSTVGAATVLMPYGGSYQMTPAQVMAAKFPVLKGETDTASVMAYGFNPYISEKSPYRGAYLAVVESLAKLAASGALTDETYLTFQEYFERLRDDTARWGKPLAALLGALDAQIDFDVASIGGKDSMSGSFEEIDVPPTLVSFAVSIVDASGIVTPEFKKMDSVVRILLPEYDETTGLPDTASQKAVFNALDNLMKQKKVLSAWALGAGGVAEGVFKMALGNRIGFSFDDAVDEATMFGHLYGGIIVELEKDDDVGTLLGRTTPEYRLTYRDEAIELAELQAENEAVLADVFPTDLPTDRMAIPAYRYACREAKKSRAAVAKPLAIIPAFPGTNGEYDMARAAEKAGIETEIFVVRNLSPQDVEESVAAFCESLNSAQMVMIPGGFSGGDEPDGSGKFITAFFRNPRVSEQVRILLNEHDGLMLGICNGFQALVKLGLLPFGEIREMDESFPTLAVNKIGRHQSRMVDVRIASNNSPWFSGFSVDEIDTMPISHGEGRFVASGEMLEKLAKSGQIATQYVDLAGNPTQLPSFNPNGSAMAIEGIFSPDGRVFGRMGHCERKASGLFRNIDVKNEKSIFDGVMAYFR